MVVNYNDIINAIAKAEDVALYNARSRAIELYNGCKPSAEANEKAIEIESWIQILTRAAATIDQDTCLDDDIIWEIIQNINEQNREVDCDVSRTYSRNQSVSGNTNVPSGYVERVLGLYVDNTNPSLPIIRIYVNPDTISGNGTEGSPFSAIGGGGGATNLGYTASPTNGIVTSSTGTDATLPLADATNAGLLTPAKFTVLQNTSGTNTGNETASTIGVIVNGASAATPNDTDLVTTVESSVVKKITWTNVKAFLKTYFDTIYTTTAAVASQITTALSGYLTAATAASTYATIASPTFTGTATTPAIIVSSETASRVAILDASKNIKSADTATYPSLAELAYVKGLTSAIQTQLNTKVYAVQCGAAIQAVVSDSTNYHMGIAVAATLNTTAALRRFKFPDAGTLKTVSWNLFQTVNGSGATVTLYLRNETAGTDAAIGTFTSNFGASAVLSTLFTGLSITVNTTDDYTFKITTPAFATNPTNWLPAAILSITP